MKTGMSFTGWRGLNVEVAEKMNEFEAWKRAEFSTKTKAKELAFSDWILTCRYSVLFGFAAITIWQQEVFFVLDILMSSVGISAQQASLAFFDDIIGHAEITIGNPTL